MAEIKSESVADFISESVADFPRNMQSDECDGAHSRENFLAYCREPDVAEHAGRYGRSSP